MAEKAKADYTATAVALNNDSRLKDKLDTLKAVLDGIKALEAKLKDNAIYTALQQQQALVSEIQAQLKDEIDSLGSYQDLELGYYAVKYRRASKEYHAESFTGKYDQFRPAVITEAINVKALEGLVKGGLLTWSQLSNDHVYTEKESFAYVVRTE